MKRQKISLILASASPRRQELLKRLDLEFTVRASRAEENPQSQVPREAVQELALLKAMEVAESCLQKEEEVLILGADTVVAADGKILGKPADAAEAEAMLSLLSGKTHQVFTGVALVLAGKGEKTPRKVFAEETSVHVAELTRDEIAEYIATGEPMDKAGAYGIQGRFAPYIRGISGDYYNVVGLPLHSLYEALKEIGGIAE